jgi:hypothetical protein
MLANRGLDRCQAPAVGGRMDASKQGSRSGARHLLWGGRMDASKQGSRSGARHLLWGGRMLANRWLDRCQAPVAPGTCGGGI